MVDECVIFADILRKGGLLRVAKRFGIPTSANAPFGVAGKNRQGFAVRDIGTIPPILVAKEQCWWGSLILESRILNPPSNCASSTSARNCRIWYGFDDPLTSGGSPIAGHTRMDKNIMASSHAIQTEAESFR